MANTNLVIKLEADIAKFQADMRTAGTAAQQAMTQMKKDAAIVGTAMSVMGVAAGAGLSLMVKDAIAAADNLRDMAQKTGIAVETLNGLGFAAKQAGGSLDGMVGAAGKLNKSIAEAASGTPAQAEAFKALGINVRDSSGQLKTADAVMAEMADKFATYADGPEKVAISMALMGKSGADMIPLLNEGGAAMRENIEYAQKYSGVTAELANGADNFNDTMGKLQVQQQGFANTMTAAVMPVLQAIASETLRATEQSNGFSTAASVARTVLETFVVVGAEVAFVFKGVGTEIGGIAAQLAALASGDIKGFTAISDAMKADAEKARAEHDAFIARIMDRAPSMPTVGPDPTKPTGRLPGLSGGGTNPQKSDAQKLEEDAQRFVAKLKEQADTFGQSGAAVLEYQMNLSKFPQVYKDEAIALQKRIDAYKAAADEDKAFAAATERFMDDRKRDIARNEMNVARIQLALMSEVDQQAVAHQMVLAELQTFHDTKFENVALANATIEKENARHHEVMNKINQDADAQLLSITQSSAEQLYSAIKEAGLEQTALGKIMFAAQKAMQVASMIVNANVAASAAEAAMITSASATAAISGLAGPAILSAGIAAGAGYASAIRTMGYISAGIVAGTAIASAEGGYDIPSGVNPMTQLHEREMVLPKQHADVIRGLATNGGGKGDFKLSLINNGTPQRVVETRQIAPDEWAMVVEDSVSAVAARMSDPNSNVSRSFSRNFATQRSR